jgi:hypothetical protein
MFIERKLNSSTGLVELWKCEWGRPGGAPAKKMFLEKIGDEQPLASSGTWSKKSAICWAYGRTLGNIAVFSEALLGEFEGTTGDDALLPCDFVNAGKYRNGVNRWWCRTHQTHWGTKGDLGSYESLKEMRCANHTQLMNYVVNPLELNFNSFAEVGIGWHLVFSSSRSFHTRNRLSETENSCAFKENRGRQVQEGGQRLRRHIPPLQ